MVGDNTTETTAGGRAVMHVGIGIGVAFLGLGGAWNLAARYSPALVAAREEASTKVERYETIQTLAEQFGDEMSAGEFRQYLADLGVD